MHAPSGQPRNRGETEHFSERSLRLQNYFGKLLSTIHQYRVAFSALFVFFGAETFLATMAYPKYRAEEMQTASLNEQIADRTWYAGTLGFGGPGDIEPRTATEKYLSFIGMAVAVLSFSTGVVQVVIRALDKNEFRKKDDPTFKEVKFFIDPDELDRDALLDLLDELTVIDSVTPITQRHFDDGRLGDGTTVDTKLRELQGNTPADQSTTYILRQKLTDPDRPNATTILEAKIDPSVRNMLATYLEATGHGKVGKIRFAIAVGKKGEVRIDAYGHDQRVAVVEVSQRTDSKIPPENLIPRELRQHCVRRLWRAGEEDQQETGASPPLGILRVPDRKIPSTPLEELLAQVRGTCADSLESEKRNSAATTSVILVTAGDHTVSDDMMEQDEEADASTQDSARRAPPETESLTKAECASDVVFLAHAVNEEGVVGGTSLNNPPRLFLPSHLEFDLGSLSVEDRGMARLEWFKNHVGNDTAIKMENLDFRQYSRFHGAAFVQRIVTLPHFAQLHAALGRLSVLMAESQQFLETHLPYLNVCTGGFAHAHHIRRLNVDIDMILEEIERYRPDILVIGLEVLREIKALQKRLQSAGSRLPILVTAEEKYCYALERFGLPLVPHDPRNENVFLSGLVPHADEVKGHSSAHASPLSVPPSDPELRKILRTPRPKSSWEMRSEAQDHSEMIHRLAKELQPDDISEAAYLMAERTGHDPAIIEATWRYEEQERRQENRLRELSTHSTY